MERCHPRVHPSGLHPQISSVIDGADELSERFGVLRCLCTLRGGWAVGWMNYFTRPDVVWGSGSFGL